jgi:hypothetical protein
VPQDDASAARRAQPRTVSVRRDRLRAWVEGFVKRHGEIDVEGSSEAVSLRASDGAVAAITVPFPPLPPSTEPLAALLSHVAADRRIGVVLVRKGGYAVGVFAGATLQVSKVGSHYVQGRTKAGGWSQQRFARRRENQSRHLYESAADEAYRLLAPLSDALDAVVTGGDRQAVAAVLSDPRLSALAWLAVPDRLPVVEPRLKVLQQLPDSFLAVRITLNELA